MRELRDLGVPADQIEAALAAQAADGASESGDLEIWPQNWPSLELFRAAETQWRPVLGFGVCFYPGLDYAAVDALMRRQQIDDPDGKLFADLMVMERAALPILNEARE